MKNLQSLTDNELVEFYQEIETCMEQEIQMDGSGELAGVIMKSFEEVWKLFEVEFELRGIQLNDCYSSDMPY